MATFTTVAGKQGNMLLAFQWPTIGIDSIIITVGLLAAVKNDADLGAVLHSTTLTPRSA